MEVRECPGKVIGFNGNLARIEVKFPAIGTGKESSREIEVKNTRKDLHPGSPVVLIVESSPGSKAAMFSYVLPTALFAIIFFGLVNVTGNAGLASLLGFFTLVPYYAILWVISGKSREVLHFRLKGE